MSQMKRSAEQQLEQIENMLARYARVRKLLEVIEVKLKFVQNERLQRSALQDIYEAQQAIERNQHDLTNMANSQLRRDIRRKGS